MPNNLKNLSSGDFLLAIAECDDIYTTNLVNSLALENIAQKIVRFKYNGYAISKLLLRPPELIVVDLDSQEVSGIGFIRRLRELKFSKSILVLSSQSDDSVLRDTFYSGANYFLHKNKSNFSEFNMALKMIRHGKNPMPQSLIDQILKSMYKKRRFPRLEPSIGLTYREREIFQLLNKGITPKAIGDLLNISYHTVRTHQKNIYRKMNVNSLSEIMVSHTVK